MVPRPVHLSRLYFKVWRLPIPSLKPGNCPEYHDNYEDENTFYAGDAGVGSVGFRV